MGGLLGYHLYLQVDIPPLLQKYLNPQNPLVDNHVSQPHQADENYYCLSYLTYPLLFKDIFNA